jgi:hypothetical protein
MLSNLHNCYSPLDERRKCKDSRRSRRPAQSVEDRGKEDQESVGRITAPPVSGRRDPHGSVKQIHHKELDDGDKERPNEFHKIMLKQTDSGI